MLPSTPYLLLRQPAPVAVVASGLMLDGITTGIKAAYSTRQLLTAYAGKSLRVQRVSDSTQSDIGFVANVLDTTALATFCSGTTGNVVTWYDQSGGGFDIIVNGGSGSPGPIIYASGAVKTLNTKPALLFVAAGSDCLQHGSLSANPTNTLFQNAVISATLATGNSNITSGITGALDLRIDQTTGTPHLLAQSTASIASASASVSNATGAIVENQYNSSSGAWSFWVDRTAQGTGTQIQSLTAATFQIGAGGSFGNVENFDGLIGEYVAYDLVGGIPSGSRTTIENNQHTYWGTP